MKARCGSMILVTVACLFSFQVSAADGASPISLQISLQKNVVKAGSDVQLEVVTTNISEQDIEIAGGTPELMYRIEVRDGNGNAVPENQIQHIRTLMPLKLAPNESHKDVILISRMFDLKRPGTYTVQVRRIQRNEPDAGTGKARSNALVLNVTP